MSADEVAYWRDRFSVLEAERDKYAEALREIVELDARHPWEMGMARREDRVTEDDIEKVASWIMEYVSPYGKSPFPLSRRPPFGAKKYSDAAREVLSLVLGTEAA